MAKAFYPTNDGHVGNLEKLSTVAIRELLKRQEDLLKKKAFVAKLPDKGEKLRSKIAILQKTLDGRKNITDIENVNKVTSNGINQYNETLKSETKIKEDSSAELKLESGDSLEICLDKLSISGGVKRVNGNNATGSHSDVTKHYFEVALERCEKNALAGIRQPIKLNRDLKIQHMKDLPNEIMKNKPVKPRPNPCATNRTKVPEESAATPPVYKYSKAQTIQLQESLVLQQKQRDVQEKLHAEIAAQKLAERLHIKTEDYNPEGVDMSYRRTSGSDVDSDDDVDDDENNYASMTVPSDTED